MLPAPRQPPPARHVEVHQALGRLFLARGDFDAAVAQLRHARNLKGADPQTRHLLALALVEAGQHAAGLHEFRALLRDRPQSEAIYRNFAAALLRAGQTAEALQVYRDALARWPQSAHVANNLAWLLATHPDAAHRDGAEAARLATAAVKQHPADAELWDTLAAAQAETGQWSQAVRTAQRGAQVAAEQGDPATAQRLRQRAQQYHRRQPLR